MQVIQVQLTPILHLPIGVRPYMGHRYTVELPARLGPVGIVNKAVVDRVVQVPETCRSFRTFCQQFYK
jgi:hypothetical protein